MIHVDNTTDDAGDHSADWYLAADARPVTVTPDHLIEYRLCAMHAINALGGAFRVVEPAYRDGDALAETLARIAGDAQEALADIVRRIDNGEV